MLLFQCIKDTGILVSLFSKARQETNAFSFVQPFLDRSVYDRFDQTTREGLDAICVHHLYCKMSLFTA